MKWKVGAKGLCGCITELMPAAKNGTRSAPLPFGCAVPVAARYASAGMLPYTTETLTPAFSQILPPCKEGTKGVRGPVAVFSQELQGVNSLCRPGRRPLCLEEQFPGTYIAQHFSQLYHESVRWPLLAKPAEPSAVGQWAPAGQDEPHCEATLWGTAGTCRTREMPPPPPWRVQASSWNFPPSICSTAAQIWSCAARMATSKRPRMLQGRNGHRHGMLQKDLPSLADSRGEAK